MTIQETLAWLQTILSSKYDQQQAAILARQLLSWTLEVSEAFLIAHPDNPVTQEQQDKLFNAVQDHLNTHKPLQYILGTAPFLSSMIVVRPPTLIPRPETEYWCHFIITLLKKLNRPQLTLLDMCTGSGCVAVALAQAFPEATIYAVDNSPEALALTKENAAQNNCTNIITIQSDLFEALPDSMFDCIVSNPPYVTQEEWETLEPVVKHWEDPHALVAYDYGLSIIKRIIAEAPRHLKRDPLFAERGVPQLLIEMGETQAENVVSSMKHAGFTPTVHTDLAGKERFVTGELNGE